MGTADVNRVKANLTQMTVVSYPKNAKSSRAFFDCSIGFSPAGLPNCGNECFAAMKDVYATRMQTWQLDYLYQHGHPA